MDEKEQREFSFQPSSFCLHPYSGHLVNEIGTGGDPRVWVGSDLQADFHTRRIAGRAGVGFFIRAILGAQGGQLVSASARRALYG